jgi:hypothetical protein
LNINWAWLRSLLPARIGFPLNISPKTHLQLLVRTKDGSKSTEYLPNTPHIDSCCITSKLKKKFRGPVPPCNN